jgi:hypothetical protein
MQLLDKKDKGFNDLRSIVMSIRLNSFKLSDVVVEYGLKLIRKYKGRLGD